MTRKEATRQYRRLLLVLAILNPSFAWMTRPNAMSNLIGYASI